MRKNTGIPPSPPKVKGVYDFAFVPKDLWIGKRGMMEGRVEELRRRDCVCRMCKFMYKLVKSSTGRKRIALKISVTRGLC